MRVAFFSNYMNHHQESFCRHMIDILGDGYFAFVSEMPIEEERLRMGYEDKNMLSFVVRSYESPEAKEKAHQIMLTFDVVIIGAESAPVDFVKERMDRNLLTFRYTERFYKKGTWRRFIPTSYYKKYRDYLRYHNKNFYALCAGYYAGTDFALLHFPKEKCLKWGYFPQLLITPQKSVNDCKQVTLLWAGRMLDWKKPVFALKIALRMKEKRLSFVLKMFGDGPEKQKAEEFVTMHKLEDVVKFYGFASPDEIRHQMQEADIYLFTSDYYEGWGAVLNEAMNARCAVIASDHAGATRYLIQDGTNGVIIDPNNVQEASDKVCSLASNRARMIKLGDEAYKTISEIWNADCAAERLIRFSEAKLSGNSSFIMCADGPCSLALKE